MMRHSNDIITFKNITMMRHSDGIITINNNNDDTQ